MSYVQALGLVRRALPHIDKRRDFGAMKVRAKLVLAAARHAGRLSALAGTPSPALQMIARERPETLIGPLIWPYLCAGWDAAERLDRIEAHYSVIDEFPAPFPFSVEERLVLIDLPDISPGLRIVLDQPKWFMREGGLTISLFVEGFRAYSLAFSLAPHDGGRECLIGSI